MSETSKSELATAADRNLATHACWAPARLGQRVRSDNQLILVDSGLPSDTFNFACRARLTSNAARSRIEEALEFFASTGHPFSWWLMPGFTPPRLPEMLQDAGLQCAESALAMSCDLSKLDQALPEIEGFRIERVRSPEALAVYARLNAANWQPPDQLVEEFYRRSAPALLAGDSPQWFYVGFMDGVPVATAELTTGGGVAGLYGISTVPAFRGRGIGSAMTRAPLLDARLAGRRTAVLQAADGGVNLYQRLGFEPFGEVIEFKPA